MTAANLLLFYADNVVERLWTARRQTVVAMVLGSAAALVWASGRHG